MITDLLNEYNEFERELAKKRDELTSQLRPRYFDLFKPFFDKHPLLEEISFTAYTPYFNDGDECIFGVNEPYLIVAGIDELDSYSVSTVGDAVSFLETGTVPAGALDLYNRYYKGQANTAEEYFRSRYSYLLDLGVEKLRQLNAVLADYNAIAGNITGISEDVIKGMFGDHVMVRITREGVETEDYDHD